MTPLRILALAALLLPALACTQPTSESPSDSADDAAALTGPPVAATETIGGDGSPIGLEALIPADSARIEGELACSFTPQGAEGPIFLAKANVAQEERSFAVVRNAGYPETLASQEAGGFDRMATGAGFSGLGLTITLRRGAATATGDESSAHDASLTVQRADGAERTYAGAWTCGP